MQYNTVVKAQAQRLARGRSSCHGPQPHHGTTGHSDPEPHEILATTSNHPLPPHWLTAVPSQHSTAQARRKARTLPWPFAQRHKSIAEHAADRANKNCPSSSSPAPVVVSFPPPLSPAPRILHYPPCASLSDPSPLQIPLAYARGPLLPARFRLEARLPGVLFLRADLLRLVAGDLGACRRPSAAGQVCFHRLLRCFAGGAHLHLLFSAAALL
jgi:hypothetical protein